MSRIGRLPIDLPSGVTVSIDDNRNVVVTGAKGILTQNVNNLISVKIENDKIYVERFSEDKRSRQLHGLTRALLRNMVEGVSQGYKKILELNGVGYRAQLKGSSIIMNLGFSHPVEIKAVKGIKYEIPTQNQIIVSGIDKQLVGLVSAQIREWRKPEPYKGKGIKYSDEVIRRKEGKTGKK